MNKPQKATVQSPQVVICCEKFTTIHNKSTTNRKKWSCELITAFGKRFDRKMTFAA